MSKFLDVVYEYYPSGISFFSGNYEDTKEYKLLTNKLTNKSIGWTRFVDSCIEEFGVSSLEDRTNNEPGNILLINIKYRNRYYIFVLYISKLINYYCYRIHDVGYNPNNYLFPDFTDKTKGYWNTQFEKIQVIINKILSHVQHYFREYTLFEDDINEIIPNISTGVHDIGEATIFNIFFSNYVY